MILPAYFFFLIYCHGKALYWVYIKRDFQKSPSEEWDSVNLVMCVRCSNFLTLKLFACGLSFLWMPLAYISITFRETQITSISKSKWITLVIYWILCNNLITCNSELIFKCYSKIVLKLIVHSYYKTKNFPKINQILYIGI